MFDVRSDVFLATFDFWLLGEPLQQPLTVEFNDKMRIRGKSPLADFDFRPPSALGCRRSPVTVRYVAFRCRL